MFLSPCGLYYTTTGHANNLLEWCRSYWKVQLLRRTGEQLLMVANNIEDTTQ
jgi:hypothetical protein